VSGTESRLRRGLCLTALGVALLAALVACGKRGNLAAPEGEEAAYTWPQTYPDPATVRPDKETDNGQVPSRDRTPTHASDITTFPESPPDSP